MTPRMRQVYALLMAGFTNKEIAQRLGIAVNTVKVHVGAIYRHVGVSGDRTVRYLVQWAAL